VKRVAGAVLFLALCLPVDARADQAWLQDLVQNVPSATGYRYGAKDSLGNGLDTLKVINSPAGGYLGVYHTLVGSSYYVRIATSTDVLHWKSVTVLASNGSQPTITRMSDLSFLLAYEQHGACLGVNAPGGRCLRLLHYPDVNALLGRKPDRSFQVKRTLSKCAEGTPNFMSTSLNPDLAHSTIRLGFHYFRDCSVDRQGDGTITNFTKWTAQSPLAPNASLAALGAWGHIGDRDEIDFEGVPYRLIEGQLVKNDFSSWRLFLFSWPFGAKKLDVRTHGGSTAFANPTASWVNAPGGGRALVVTQFLPVSGAAPGEAGELIYYKVVARDPVIAAAGDIACSPSSGSFNGGLGTASACGQGRTSDLLLNNGLAAVLPLGDNQYEGGELTNYLGSYRPSWGRIGTVTHPALGNHEYGTSGAAGYFDYFNGVGASTGPAGERGKGYYSFGLGAWHLIALNSNCTRVSCAAGSPQEQWLRADLAANTDTCTLAYWHHPRFSSGQHGDNPITAPLWQALYDYNADLILSGHDHLYERFAPQTPTGEPDPARGMREFVVGTGGRSHYSFGVPKPNSEARNSDAFGVLKLTLHPGSYDWNFVPEAGATFTDSGSANCH
jgi:acid phosphatase type 7